LLFGILSEPTMKFKPKRGKRNKKSELKDKNPENPKEESQRSPTATSFSCSSAAKAAAEAAKILTRLCFRFLIAFKKIRFSEQRKSRLYWVYS